MNKAAFLDRDGVINRKAPKGEYIVRWEDVQFLSGVAEAIALLKQSGYLVVVITNQRCVAKGQISIPELEALHQRMREHLAKNGAEIDAIYYCPHEKQPVCRCRKPAAGMLLDAARDHKIDLAASWMIGDSKSDVESGRNAGCNTAWLDVGNETAKVNADLTAHSLLEAVEQILQREVAGAARVSLR